MPIEKDQVITLGVIALVLIAGLVVGWMPANNAIKSHEAELTSLRSKISSNQKKTSNLAEMSVKVKALEQSLENQPKRLTQEFELASVLRQLSSNLQAQQVADQTILTRSMKHGDDFNLMPLRLTFKSDFVSAYMFLQKFEQMPRLMHLSRLEIEEDSKASEAGLPICKVQIDIDTFFTPGEGGAL